MNQSIFRHYAGDVTYNVNAFLDRNNDALHKDLKNCLVSSSHGITKTFYTQSEINQRKIPLTAATQFKNSLNNLMEILKSKEPSYVRCIKPNEHKSPRIFDSDLVNHQVKYLGLMENLRIRRAGFAYRRGYEYFLNRFKSLAEKTWPNWKFEKKDGALEVMRSLGINEEEFKLGRTKIFIRNPKTVVLLEEALEKRKEELATLIQAKYKAFIQRKKYEALKQAQIVFSKHYRAKIACRIRREREAAVENIRKFVKGFIMRKGPITDEIRYFVKNVRLNYVSIS